MSTYHWTRWSGAHDSIEADTVTFESGHIAFWDFHPSLTGGVDRVLVLAIKNVDVNFLTFTENRAEADR